MILAVTGGRNYRNRQVVDAALSKYIRPNDSHSAVIHGNAPGADTLAADWAHRNGIHTVVVEPMWSQFGIAAGPLRNRIMAWLKPEILLAFPGGKGTKSMIDIAHEEGIFVERVEE